MECVSSTCTCVLPPYRRVLSEDFEESQLFALLDGEELLTHVNKYEAQKMNPDTTGLCHAPTSAFHGREASHTECLGKYSPLESPLPPSIADTSFAKVPYKKPNENLTNTLAPNPGIWSVDHFMTPSELQAVMALVQKYGEDMGQFGPCKDEESHASHAHPQENKYCFKISPQNVCDGPYYRSKCELQTEAADSAFVTSILDRFSALWPTLESKATPYLKFQISKGGTEPVDLHTDSDCAIAMVLYLTNGGANLIFPAVDVRVVPKFGRATTWWNVDAHGNRNPMADHAVQAHPEQAGDRLIMLFEVPNLL